MLSNENGTALARIDAHILHWGPSRVLELIALGLAKSPRASIVTTCETCKFFHRHDASATPTGDCHRFPAVSMTLAIGWCGEHQAKP